jgi:glyoxylase I family protein
MQDRPSLTGFHHVTLTVPDVFRSAEWYTDVLGFKLFATIPHPVFQRVALRHAEMQTLLTLIAHPSTGDTSFDEAQVGLDHVAFGVTASDDIDRWAAWLDAKRVPRSEVKDGALPGSRLITFRDPDGIQIECYYS